MNSSIIEQLKPFIKENWSKKGFANPTPIQEKAIPLILEKKDVIAQSPTGTGKTLAYLLPVIEKVDPGLPHVQAVILASSHELVMQIFQEIQEWSGGSEIKAASFIGGGNIKRQIEKLKKRPHIIAGTPGRLLELIKQKKIKMHEVKMIVIDEGDQLLVPEHLQTVKGIVDSALRDRQVLLFSATLTEKTEELAKQWMSHPEVIKVDEMPSLNQDVEHIYFVCEERDKVELIGKLMRTEPEKVLAFSNDIGQLNVLASKLSYEGLTPSILHSETKKQDRENAIKSIRSGKSNLLLATDVAARGLDIKGLTHVLHLDLSRDLNQYVHRSGRTGRLGSHGGTVVSFVSPREERELKKMARELGIELHKKIFYKGEIADA
ncbi:MAG TPA: DEAD/DEAH box helicase [Bacillus sp. (in: firmicutes)]|uniref:DEAD/DEAH box helicase n=1 Tax=Bacillus litorisediminis TaxID=2922713 RepID=UPI001FABD2E9|nr:DEAD/DEAH box helicase [Bacillus litorisediminis]HWO74528.1 DEAD/DEAH box helicase [Bacillus sp. (in: firmicutes)]